LRGEGADGHDVIPCADLGAGVGRFRAQADNAHRFQLFRFLSITSMVEREEDSAEVEEEDSQHHPP
jgi:hypothetical protein